MGCEAVGYYFSMAYLTATKASETLTPHLKTAERSLGVSQRCRQCWQAAGRAVGQLALPGA